MKKKIRKFVELAQRRRDLYLSPTVRTSDIVKLIDDYNEWIANYHELRRQKFFLGTVRFMSMEERKNDQFNLTIECADKIELAIGTYHRNELQASLNNIMSCYYYDKKKKAESNKN